MRRVLRLECSPDIPVEPFLGVQRESTGTSCIFLIPSFRDTQLARYQKTLVPAHFSGSSKHVCGSFEETLLTSPVAGLSAFVFGDSRGRTKNGTCSPAIRMGHDFTMLFTLGSFRTSRFPVAPLSEHEDPEMELVFPLAVFWGTLPRSHGGFWQSTTTCDFPGPEIIPWPREASARGKRGAAETRHAARGGERGGRVAWMNPHPSRLVGSLGVYFPHFCDAVGNLPRLSGGFVFGVSGRFLVSQKWTFPAALHLSDVHPDRDPLTFTPKSCQLPLKTGGLD